MLTSADAVAATTRTVPRALGVVIAAAMVPVVLTRLRGGVDLQGALVASSLFVGAGAGYAVDDKAARTLASSPTPLVWRRGQRLLLVTGVLLTTWIACFAVAATSPAPIASPINLTPYLAAAAAIATGVATRVEPDGAMSPGFVAALGSLLTVLLIDSLSFRFSWAPSLHHGSARHWWWITTIALAAALWASRDPAMRVPTRRRR